ncbi:MAG TPA: FHIPEP family type III secretion protein [Solirubrobacteraceae bacterium]|nr:FHIPEP family type III secretion protein [Solirubrobacteraceae bacterium]
MSPPVPVTVALGYGLHGSASLSAALQTAVADELGRIGLPGEVHMSVTRHKVPRAFRVRVHGQLLPYEPELLIAVWQGVAPPDEHGRPYARRHDTGFPDAWLAAALERLDPALREERLEAVAVELMLELLRCRPEALIDDAVAAAYAQAVPPSLLRSIVALTGTLRDRGRVTAAITTAHEMGVSPSDTAEHVHAALRDGRIEVHVNADDLPQLYGAPGQSLRTGEWKERYEWVEEGLFTWYGLPLPDAVLIADADLERGQVRVHIGGVPGPVARGIGESELLAKAPPAKVPGRGRPAIDPRTGYAAALVGRAAADRLSGAGIEFVDARGLLLDFVVRAVRTHRRRLIGIEELDEQLAQMRALFPAVVRSATATFALADLVRIARLLVDELVPIRDLRGLLDRLLEYDAAALGPPRSDNGAGASTNGAGPGEAALERHADFVRRGLGDLFASRLAPDGSLSAVRVDRALERRLADGAHVSERRAIRIRDAFWELCERASVDQFSVVVVTTSGARRALRRALAPELPYLAVVASSELPMAVELTTVGTIEP